MRYIIDIDLLQYDELVRIYDILERYGEPLDDMRGEEDEE